MARGDITRDAVLEAMKDYVELSPDGYYRTYGYKDARDYVIDFEGREYPSKGIYGVAYDKLHPDLAPLRERGLSGGLERVVPELRELGFRVRGHQAPTDVLRSGIELVLSQYADARRTQPFGSAAPIWAIFKSLNDAFQASAPVSARPTVHAAWSAGQGNWARIAWVAFLDSRETSTTRRGVYPVLLFRQDLTGAYLTLAQGVTEPKSSAAQKRWLTSRASRDACAAKARSSWTRALCLTATSIFARTRD